MSTKDNKRRKTGRVCQHEYMLRKKIKLEDDSDLILEGGQQKVSQNVEINYGVNKTEKCDQYPGLNIPPPDSTKDRNYELSKIVNVTVINEAADPSVEFEIHEICSDTEPKQEIKNNTHYCRQHRGRKKHNQINSQNSECLKMNMKPHPKLLNSGKKSATLYTETNGAVVDPKSTAYKTSFLRILKSDYPNNRCSESSEDNEDEQGYETKNHKEMGVKPNTQEFENKALGIFNESHQKNPYSKFVQKMLYESLGIDII